MKQLKDLQKEYQSDKDVIKQLTDEFGDYSQYEKEYDDFFNNNLIKEIEQLPNGNVAGAGPVDYNEGKVLFIYIRKHKPRGILELGMAAGCSAVIMANAIRLNTLDNKLDYGVVYTVDISDDNYEKSIPLFKEFNNNALLCYKLGIDAIKFIQEFPDNHLIDMIFVDASHQQEFCFDIAKLLKQKHSNKPIFYHEWGLSNLASPKEQSYVSLTENISKVGFHDVAEREAFEEVFSSRIFEHKGFYGSCGLGLIRPKKLNIFYRISSKEAFTHKDKLTDKLTCLRNFITQFGKNNILIQADNCSKEILEEIKKYENYNIAIIETKYSNSSESFIELLNKVLKLSDDEIVYIVEDDYLHWHFAEQILREGIELGSHYVTLYDHPDKYINADMGGNPQIKGGGEVTRVLLSKSCYWKLTNSTCLTFATTVKNIREDYDIWKKCVFETPSLGSYIAFSEIRKKNKTLISSIPGYSTHTELKWLSPQRNWGEII